MKSIVSTTNVESRVMSRFLFTGIESIFISFYLISIFLFSHCFMEFGVCVCKDLNTIEKCVRICMHFDINVCILTKLYKQLKNGLAWAEGWRQRKPLAELFGGRMVGV